VALEVGGMMRLVQKGKLAAEFNGWDADAVFEFTNGNKWQQAKYKYRYKYKYRPNAQVWADGSKFWIEVEGMPEMVQVRRA
jgi:hypothetical protein